MLFYLAFDMKITARDTQAVCSGLNIARKDLQRNKIIFDYGG